MALLIDIFGLLSVLLSGAEVVAQSFVVGGIAFVLLVIRPFDVRLGEAASDILRRCRRLIFWSAASLALIGLISLLVEASILVDTADITWASAPGRPILGNACCDHGGRHCRHRSDQR